MAAGACLLVSERGGLPEYTAGVSVPIDPDDAGALAAALRAVATDPVRRAALAEAGRSRAREYDVGKGVARLEALREDILTAWLARTAVPI